MDIKANYQKYIETLNAELSPGCLDPYIKDGAVHNGFHIASADDAVRNVRKAQAVLPGLQFKVDQIIVEKDAGAQGDEGFANAAVRAVVSYFPEPGKEVTFIEHVFYRLEAGKIAQSKSVVDVLELPEKDQGAAKRL